MTTRRFLIATVLTLSCGFSTVTAQTTRYWDTNGTADGATTAGFSDGTWNNANTLWNTDSTGGAGGAVTGWTANDNAVFSAGTDTPFFPQPGTTADNADIGGIVTVSAESVANTVTFEEGTYLLSGSGLNAPQTIIKAGAHVEYALHTVYLANLAGKITLQGGELENNNTGHAGTLVKNTMSLEVDGSGIIRYDDASFRLSTTPDCNCTIYTPLTTNTILGVGGTVDNGGAGTLIKRGVGEIRYQGVGLPLSTFQKLRVEEGLFRLGFSASIQDERGFGAVPTTFLADAITLDGGFIGHSFNATPLHANRGITIGPNGGGWSGGTSTIPAAISGTGRFTTLGGQLTLTSASNSTTFTGSWNIEGGTVVVAGDGFLGAAPGAPVADHIMMGGVNPLAVATTGTLSFSASTTLNANRGITLTTGGTGRLNIATGVNTLTYDGVITGAGKLIKMGDGTLTTSGANTYSGGTDVYGRLIVNNTSGSGTGTGAVAVKTLLAGLGTNGTLSGTDSISGPVTVESGAHVAPGNLGIGTLSVGSLSLATGSILDFELGAPTTADLLNVVDANGFTVAAASATINLTNAGGLANGTYKLIDYVGSHSGAFANLVLGTQPAGFTFALVDNLAGTSIDLSVTGAGPVGVSGDYNNNGVVDAADYVVWKNAGATDTLANDTTPGTVSSADYDVWRANFGKTPGSGSSLGGSTAVPEPTSMLLVVLGVAGLFASRRGR